MQFHAHCFLIHALGLVWLLLSHFSGSHMTESDLVLVSCSHLETYKHKQMHTYTNTFHTDHLKLRPLGEYGIPQSVGNHHHLTICTSRGCAHINTNQNTVASPMHQFAHLELTLNLFLPKQANSGSFSSVQLHRLGQSRLYALIYMRDSFTMSHSRSTIPID